MQIVVTILVLAGVIGLYLGSYVLNKNTPVPEGIIPIEQCASCSTTACSHFPGSPKDDIRAFLDEDKTEYECEI